MKVLQLGKRFCNSIMLQTPNTPHSLAGHISTNMNAKTHIIKKEHRNFNQHKRNVFTWQQTQIRHIARIRSGQKGELLVVVWGPPHWARELGRTDGWLVHCIFVRKITADIKMKIPNEKWRIVNLVNNIVISVILIRHLHVSKDEIIIFISRFAPTETDLTYNRFYY